MEYGLKMRLQLYFIDFLLVSHFHFTFVPHFITVQSQNFQANGRKVQCKFSPWEIKDVVYQMVREHAVGHGDYLCQAYNKSLNLTTIKSPKTTTLR